MRTETAWMAFFCVTLLLLKPSQADRVAMNADLPPPPSRTMRTLASRPDTMQALQQDCGQNCQECSDDGKCSKCDPGYGNTDQGKCAACPAGCAECPKSAASCETCKSGYRLNNGQCYFCSVENCAGCSPDGTKCTVCADGYTLNSKGDVCEIICHDDNCLKCKDGQMCETCKPGYGLNPEGKCGLCSVTNCAECNADATKCTKCNANFIPSTQKDACVKFDGVSRVSGPLFIGLISVLGTAVLL